VAIRKRGTAATAPNGRSQFENNAPMGHDDQAASENDWISFRKSSWRTAFGMI
jgi:hypothetical protein